MNAGDVQSQAVYPLASNVALNPPDGNEDASGSPLISSFPENSSKTLPSSVGLMKASCFSAEVLYCTRPNHKDRHCQAVITLN